MRSVGRHCWRLGIYKRIRFRIPIEPSQRNSQTTVNTKSAHGLDGIGLIVLQVRSNGLLCLRRGIHACVVALQTMLQLLTT